MPRMPSPPCDVIYKIRHKATGMYYSGGFSGYTDRKGKSWSGMRYVRTWLRQKVGYYSNRNPQSDLVREILLGGLEVLEIPLASAKILEAKDIRL